MVVKDIQGVVRSANNPPSGGGRGHIDVRHHILRELVGDGEIQS